jgi:capsular exopolysaccharide synthesis family protein
MAALLPADAAWSALPALQLNGDDLRKKRIVAFAGGKEAVYFDVMRTKVLQQIRANGWRRIAITSPTAGCGKSTISLNLAISLARQPEMRTVLLDLDLRRPSLGKMLGIQDRPSFSDVLAGKLPFDQVAMRYEAGLAIAVNKGPAHNPAELLHGSSVTVALNTIETQYAPDVMLFDMPPMLVSDDTMAFIGQVDAVLLIAAAEMTSIKEIDSCERELAGQTNVMGVVLNKCEYMGKEYGYSYYG